MNDNTTPEASAARAMDRVLDAERAAQAQISDCEKEVAAVLEQARFERQRIVERARSRIVALHTRAAGTLQKRAASVGERRRESAAAALDSESSATRRAEALDRLAARLTSDEKKSQDAF